MRDSGNLFLLVLLLWVFISRAECATISASDLKKGGCSDQCGNVTVSYPYGFGESHCAFDAHFLLDCNDSTYFLGSYLPIFNISLEEGTLSVGIEASVNCYNISQRTILFNQSITLGSGPFRFSSERNKLTVVGCDTLAFMSDSVSTFASGCVSLCTNLPNITQDKSCSGIGCCQTPVPQNLKTLNIFVSSLENHSKVLGFNPCGYAFISDERNFDAARYGLTYQDAFVNPAAVIEWVIREETCEKAQSNISTYACGNNSYCSFSENVRGYRCLCNEGFRGNPYFTDGCQDIDECNEPKAYKCEGKCKNTIGNYECKCALGMRGDGKISCQGFRFTTIITVIAGVIAMAIIGLLIFVMFQRRKKEKNFLQNGGVLLKNQRVRIFSEAELAKATKNYDKSLFLGEGGFGSVYKGILEDKTQVAVKKPKGVDKAQVNQESQQEIAIVSQVNHKNVVKLLGLCMETAIPLLVYELISNGTLNEHIHGKKSTILRNWEGRLRIAAETALALDYLHSLADPPIIHSDVKSANILLDDNYTAKVSDFGASVLIPTDDVIMATKIQGTLGYLDPEYLMTGILTAKSDVYSFGILLVELLTGVNPCSASRSKEKGNIVHYFISSLKSNSLFNVLDFEVNDDEEREEIELVAGLAKSCIDSSGIRRPAMKEVAEELGRLRRSHISVQQNDETEHLLGESSYFTTAIVSANMNKDNTYSASYFTTATVSANMNKDSTYSASTLDIESYDYSI